METLNKSVLIGFLLLGAACGGESDGGGGRRNVDTGLPETTPLADVTPAQFDQACDSVTSTANARFSAERQTRIACELVGSLISANAGSCRDFAENCVANPPDQMMAGVPEGGMIAESACGDGSALSGCTATVGEFETCINEFFDALDQLAQQFSCANAPIDPENVPTDFGVALPDSCDALEMKCPGAVEFAQPE